MKDYTFIFKGVPFLFPSEVANLLGIKDGYEVSTEAELAILKNLSNIHKSARFNMLKDAFSERRKN